MIVRLYTGDDGQGHFQELDLRYEQQANSARTPPQSVQGVIFRKQEPGTFLDFHVAPRPQYIVNLAGYGEIGLESGEVRTFGPGDVMLAEDLTGKGHTTRVVGNETRVSIVIPL